MLRCFWMWPWKYPPAVQHSGMLGSNHPGHRVSASSNPAWNVNRHAALLPSTASVMLKQHSYSVRKRKALWNTNVQGQPKWKTSCVRSKQLIGYTNVFASCSKRFRLFSRRRLIGRTSSFPDTDTKWLGRIAQSLSHLVSRLKGSTRPNGPAADGNCAKGYLAQRSSFRPAQALH
jgi:hypothetical protein